MSILPGQLSQQARQELRDELISGSSDLLLKIPKVELHVHIEGTLTPELRWKLGKRNGMPILFGTNKTEIQSLKELQTAYEDVISSAQLYPGAQQTTFFQAYYSGFEFLKTRQDFFDLAMGYFERAAAMNVRYCEPFFDPQAHISRGVSWDDMMGGFKEAQEVAENKLNVQSSWIMCFLRDQAPEAAMDCYKASLKYRDMIIGFGLDSNERDHPPSLFEEVFAQARRDGFKLTAHCDVGVKDTHRHIRQVATTMAGFGLDRIDHGLNVADNSELTALVVQRDLLMTICPWAYLRRETYASIAQRIRILIDAGAKVCIASDSPVYTDNSWVTHNLLLTQRMCSLTDSETIALIKNAVNASWAAPELKELILREIDVFGI